MADLSIIKERQYKANEAIRELRRLKLSQGQFFMINSRRLPSGQCYLEFPDGHIRIASISSTKRDFTVVRDLSASEVAAVRHQFKLH